MLLLSARRWHKTLSNHGVDAILDSANGTIDIQIDWQGSLFNMYAPSLTGSASVVLKDGVIFDLKNYHAQKWLSIVNILSIPRRFSLDFSDLGDHFEYYTIGAELKIKEGILRMNNEQPFRLYSSLGILKAYGLMDLPQGRNDIVTHLVPNVVTFTAPLAGVFVGGPCLGCRLSGDQLVFDGFWAESRRHCRTTQQIRWTDEQI